MKNYIYISKLLVLKVDFLIKNNLYIRIKMEFKVVSTLGMDSLHSKEVRWHL